MTRTDPLATHRGNPDSRNPVRYPPTWRGMLLLLLLPALLLLGACNDETPVPTAPVPTALAPATTVSTDAANAVNEPVVATVVATAPPAQDGDADRAAATPAPAAASPTPDSPRGNLVVWHSWAGQDADALAAILDGFAARYPGVAVDTLYVAYNDLPQSYADAVALDAGPDLIFAPNWWLSDLVSANATQPLDQLLTAADLEGIWPAALDNLRVGGALHALPVSVDLAGLYVNTDLLPAAGIPATTADWLAAVQTDPAAGSGLYLNLYHLYWGIPAYGGQLMDADGTVIVDATSGAADFLTWLQSMSQSQGNYVDLDYGMLLDRFKKGEFPYFVDGPWAAPELTAALGDALTVAPLPAGPAGPAQPWLSADGVVLNPTLETDQQALALLLMREMTSPAAGTAWAQIAGRIPNRVAVELGESAILAGFAAQAATAQSMPARPEMDAVWGYAGDMLVKVINGVMEPGEAVTEAAALINDQNGKP